MSTRSVVVRLEAQVAPYLAAFEKAEKATDAAATAVKSAGKASDELTQSLGETADAQKRYGDAAKEAAPKTAASTQSIEEQAAAAQEAAKALGLQYDATGKLVDSNEKLLSSAEATALGMESFSGAVYLNGREAEEASNAATSAAEEAAAAAEEQAEAAVDVGEAMAVFGSATVAALGLAAKAAMDWESAWAGVTKTVDGTPEEMAELEEGLRGLAKVLPTTHEEIAGVAEAAGQLGVARKDVVGFTKTMIDLSETTNLTADDAATNIAQISNVMGTMAREGAIGVEKFGSALVALGNDGASTEAEILDMSQRIAGAGKLIGASESDVLALANAMASVGIKAELGGGVISRVMTRMYADVQDGGEGLETLAQVAGVSAAEFADAFEKDPVRAIDMMVKGLGQVKDSGGNVVQTMKDIGIKGTEETSVLLSLVGAGDLLTESLDLGATAWEENSALAEEASKRYETTESKVTVAWNNIQDAIIDAGAVVLPAISEMADGVTSLAQMFGDLPAPVQTAIVIITGIVGVATLVGGAFLTLLPKAQALNASLIAMGPAGKVASAGLITAGKAAGIGAAALGVFLVAAEIAGSGMDKLGSASQFETAMHQMSDDAAMGEESLDSLMTATGNMGAEVGGLGDSLKKVNLNGFLKGLDWVGGLGGIAGLDTSVQLADKALDGLDTALAKLATGGNFDLAAKGFREAAKAGEEQGLSLEQVSKSFPDYMAALRNAAIEQGGYAEGADLLSMAMGEIPPKIKEAGDAAAIAAAQEQVAAQMSEDLAAGLEEVGVTANGSIGDIQKFTEALLNTGLVTMSSRDATFAWSDTLRDMGAEIEAIMISQETLGSTINDTATDFNTTTDAGLAANSMFQDIVKQGMDVAATFSGDLAKSQEDVQGQLTSTYDAGVRSAQGLGLSEEAAIALTREVMNIPPGVDIKSWMADTAKRMADETRLALEAIPKSTTIKVNYENTTTNRVNTIHSESHIAEGPGGRGGLTRASGGPIFGPGTGTSDDVPVMASNGEHMLTAAEVQAAGGHGAVFQLRSQLLQGNQRGVPMRTATAMAPARQLVSAGSAPAPNFNVTGTFINPFTGKEVVAVMQGIAVTEANNAVSAANTTAGRRPAR